MRINQFLGFILRFGVFGIIAAFFFVGCSDDDDGPTGPDGQGTFSVTISGDMSKSFSGTAIFGSGTDPETGESGFALILQTDMDNEQAGDIIWIVRIGATRPGTGQMPIANFDDIDDDDFNPQVLYGMYAGENAWAWSTSGTMSITTSSSNQFAGSFEFSADGFTMNDPDSEKTVTIGGEFNAVGGDIFWPGF